MPSSPPDVDDFWASQENLSPPPAPAPMQSMAWTVASPPTPPARPSMFPGDLAGDDSCQLCLAFEAANDDDSGGIDGGQLSLASAAAADDDDSGGEIDGGQLSEAVDEAAAVEDSVEAEFAASDGETFSSSASESGSGEEFQPDLSELESGSSGSEGGTPQRPQRPQRKKQPMRAGKNTRRRKSSTSTQTEPEQLLAVEAEPAEAQPEELPAEASEQQRSDVSVAPRKVAAATASASPAQSASSTLNSSAALTEPEILDEDSVKAKLADMRTDALEQPPPPKHKATAAERAKLSRTGPRKSCGGMKGKTKASPQSRPAQKQAEIDNAMRKRAAKLAAAKHAEFDALPAAPSFDLNE